MVQVTLFSVSFLVLYLTQLIFSVWMNRLNQAYIRHKGNQVPRAFRGLIDADKLAQINAYSLDNLQSSTVRKTVGDAVLLLLILSGGVVGRLRVPLPCDGDTLLRRVGHDLLLPRAALRLPSYLRDRGEIRVQPVDPTAVDHR